MCVQLADSTIQYTEGIAKNVLVRVCNSFVLADFVVMDIEGDLGIELILGRPFLRATRARIDVERGEIRFRVGKENMFFRFKQREEQRILNRQDDKGRQFGMHLNPHYQNLRPHNQREDIQRRCGVRSQARPLPILQDELSNGNQRRRKVPLVRL